MIARRALVIVAALLFAQTTFAQSNRLRQLSSQLANEASSYADSSYNDSSRYVDNSVEMMMAAHQFSAAAQLFNRMVNDRRRNQDLVEAHTFLQNSWRNAYRNETRNNRGTSIQGLLFQIGRELNMGDSGNNNQGPFPYPDQGGPSRSGSMNWRGRVDDDVRIKIRGGSADVETIGGTPYYDAVTNFTNSLPPRRVTVTLVKRRGRGDVFLEQQPSRENGYTAVVRIRDSRGGASDYEFDLSW